MAEPDIEYYKDPSQRILELMKTTLKESPINMYYLGSPDEIAEAAYPCLVVQPMNAKVSFENAPTNTDNAGEEINIEVYFNAKDDYNSSSDQDTTMRKIYQLIQGRDPATGQWMAGTIMYALRTNITLENLNLDQEVDVTYDVQPRPEQPTIMIGIVTVVIRGRVTVLNRN